MENQKVTVVQQSIKLATEDIFHLGVKVVLKNSNNEILLLKVEKGTKSYGDLPGGRVQKNESIEATALREVAEEIGITKLSSLQYLGMFLSAIRIPLNDRETVGLIFAFYTAQIEEASIVLSQEHQLYEWTTYAKAMEILLKTYGEAFIKLWFKESE